MRLAKNIVGDGEQVDIPCLQRGQDIPAVQRWVKEVLRISYYVDRDLVREPLPYPPQEKL